MQEPLATPLRAASFLGVFWAAWHLPRAAANSFDAPGAFLWSRTTFPVVSVFLPVIISFFFNKTGGSTLIAIAVHGLSNDSVGTSGTGMSASGTLADLLHAVPYVVCGSLLILLAGPRLGCHRDAAFEDATSI